MTEKEWDEKLKRKLEESCRETYSDWHYIWGFIKKDRKHQKSERLKRLPSVKEMSKILDEMRIDDEDPITSDFEENELEIATEIHKLVKDKLK